MTSQEFLHADYLDIVFNDRNKVYGGYELRKSYHLRMRKALGSIMLILLVVSAYSIIKKEATQIELQVNPALPPMREIVMNTEKIIEPPKPKVVDEPAAKAAGKAVATVDNTEPIIVKKADADELPKPNVELVNAISSNVVTKGDSAAGYTGPAGDGTDVGGVQAKKGGGGNSVGLSIADIAEVMPEFNGNIGAYLQNNLRYPEMARTGGVSGRVAVQFVVNEDGSISNARVTHSIGGGCDEEALRVINSMPRWKPGKQNGRAVKVWYTQVIKFVIQD